MTGFLNNCGLKIVAVALLLSVHAFCQEEQKPTPPSEQKQEAVKETADTYRLDLVIRELQDGKAIGARSYSTLVRDEPHGGMRRIRVGSRLPVSTGGTSWSYLEAGTEISLGIRTIEGKLVLRLNVDMSSIASPEPAPAVKLAEQPVMRHFGIDQEAAIPLGKPTLLNSVDDPNSNHKFQIEVTATKEKI